ncbi:DUF2889 domain-containing protein [Blastococcus sp. CT_GayMR16]|uniref:DUF2889 domain-containing protein n=1 Tax=Blastococcus sp. CT_GayMR16 TaxID=2559607 RepID=UPI0010731529|nr:DUF2889 domain-containing protein [Blastococcus sp. CT_GayMR16]TFV88823.1 DUF2889 domain-containing protein [Blastococcus sp. CT_GayMR16]
MSVDQGSPGIAAPGGMATPVQQLPAPATPGARREVSIVIAPQDAWTSGTEVRARARDVVRGGNASTSTREPVEIAVRTDASGVLEDVRIPAAPQRGEALRGRAVRGGFRAGLSALDGLDPTSPEAGLLDDLPTVRLISGYALMMEAEESPAPPTGQRRAPLVGICSGWRADGVAVQRAMAEVPLLGAAATTPPLESVTGSPEAFLEEEALAPRTMRRRRVLEIAPAADGGWDVFAYLRDSHVDRAGIEHGLHEYVVTATAGRGDLRLRSVVAEPRTLPFRDCPLASPNVDRLIGMPAGEAGSGVVDRLPGAAGCTHLNDLLRTFRFLPRLAAMVDRGDTDEH